MVERILESPRIWIGTDRTTAITKVQILSRSLHGQKPWMPSPGFEHFLQRICRISSSNRTRTPPDPAPHSTPQFPGHDRPRSRPTRILSNRSAAPAGCIAPTKRLIRNPSRGTRETMRDPFRTHAMFLSRGMKLPRGGFPNPIPPTARLSSEAFGRIAP